MKWQFFCLLFGISDGVSLDFTDFHKLDNWLWRESDIELHHRDSPLDVGVKTVAKDEKGLHKHHQNGCVQISDKGIRKKWGKGTNL